MRTACIGLLFLTAACVGGTGQGRYAVFPKSISEVYKENLTKLMALPGVVGTAVSLCGDKSCIKVYVTKRTLELDHQLPETLDGYPIVIKETGKFQALPGAE